MKWMSLRSFAAFGLLGAALMPGFAQAEQDRISGSEKGSLLIYSKVEVRQDGTGEVVMDTFLTMTNDFNSNVRVRFYHINGDFWTNVNTQITLTMNQPIFWSARTGQPAGGGMGSGNVSPFPSAGPAIIDPMTGDTVWRGYIVAWAVNTSGQPIRWNHLAGNAMLVNYRSNYAWSYNAWASQASNAVAHGARVSPDSGILRLNGTEYAPAYEQLLFNFYAPGAILSSGFMGPAIRVDDTSLTLHLVDVDLRQDGNVRATKADIDIWNMNESKFSNTRRCIVCWDQTFLSVYTLGSVNGGVNPPNNFLLSNLQTRAGKARIQGNASADCHFYGFNGLSESLPLLGVEGRILSRVGSDIRRDSLLGAGSNLFGMGAQNAVIQYSAGGSGGAPESAEILEELKRPTPRVPRRGQ